MSRFGKLSLAIVYVLVVVPFTFYGYNLFAKEGGINREHIFGPGDRKDGYETGDYTTNALSIEARVGKAADLIKFAESPPLGLPPLPIVEDNAITEEKIQLGRRLFFDRRLSLNDTFSCAICHVPEQGFTNNELATAVGLEGRSNLRNSPTIYNVAYYSRIFHDGRESTLEQQVWAPLLTRTEMANPSIGYVINKIKAIDDYDGLFEAAFDGRGPTMETVGQALAVYQRTLVSGDSRFDRWYYGKQEDAMNASEKRGFKLFMDKGCAACHTVNSEYALFTDNQMHNTGFGYHNSMAPEPETTRVVLAPGVFVDVKPEVIKSVSRVKSTNDLGLYEVTQNPHDRWKFRTPILRNVALTAPYMHNGSKQTLREVMEFYNQGGVENELLSPLIKPLGLDDSQIDDLIAFMHALTGSNVETIVADAFAAPIGDVRASDPSWANEKGAVH